MREAIDYFLSLHAMECLLDRSEAIDRLARDLERHTDTTGDSLHSSVLFDDD